MTECNVLTEENLLSRKESGSSGGHASPPVKASGPKNKDPTPDLPRDDLRAYAYEGDGSSSGSLTSTISGELRPTKISISNYSQQ